MKSGETVRIDTLSHQGATQQEDPIAMLAKYGVKREEILQDVLDFRASWPDRPRRGGHILTGPIAIEGAMPGDVIEVQILELKTRVPWGMNGTSANGGPFRENYPGSRPGDKPLEIPDAATRHVIRTGMSNGREVAFFSDKIQVPLTPFMGIMAVAPGETKPGDIGVTPEGIADVRAAGTVRWQPGFQGAHGWDVALPPRVPRGRAVLRRRSARRAGRW